MLCLCASYVVNVFYYCISTYHICAIAFTIIYISTFIILYTQNIYVVDIVMRISFARKQEACQATGQQPNTTDDFHILYTREIHIYYLILSNLKYPTTNSPKSLVNSSHNCFAPDLVHAAWYSNSLLCTLSITLGFYMIYTYIHLCLHTAKHAHKQQQKLIFQHTRRAQSAPSAKRVISGVVVM